MKTLYTRIIVTMFLILLLSGAVSLLFSNVAYYRWWQPSYSEKTEAVANGASIYFEQHTDEDADAFYMFLAAAGYQLVVIDTTDGLRRYGGAFRDETISDNVIEAVREGTPYQGMRDFPFHLFLLGLFDNELTNTYGFALDNGDIIFIRPDLSAQIRELHLFVGMFFALVTLLAFGLIAISTRSLVRPLKTLTKATTSVAMRKEPEDLPIERQDEIGTLARQFQDMSNTINQTEARQRRFVSNVSHEFQSPLTSLVGYAEKLVDGTDGVSNEYARVIEQETRRLSQLTKQLLLLSRLDENPPILETKVNVLQSVSEVIQINAFLLDQKGIAVIIDIPNNVELTSDPVLLAQVWNNVLVNAIHASHEGGTIQIICTLEPHVTISFTDEGIGMNEETKQHLFDRFYRGDTARTSRGTGLGLAITSDILDLHGGQITLESSEGIGTTIHLHF
ncbi:HAMP domain-containing sensor histidine kinase [Exiguobacterium sp. ERU653]|uniref:sensor histidine kinase n=1 Tax=Exiguobacterium sp. ERU653 TaxID=2751254 RepID=UPI001BEA2278|nr:HAMP domain-containing sensor histidine kinase [Exiguobacterium sp. ERU653]